MQNVNYSTLLLLFAVVLFTFSSCTKEETTITGEAVETEIDFRNVTSIGGGGMDPAPSNQDGPTIVDLAVATPDLSILVEAVVAAGLDGALASAGNFTVFAPTNDAFVQFLADNGFNSLDEVPVDVLTTVLLTHVLGSEFFAADFSTNYFKTLAGGPQDLPTDVFVNTASGVTINGDVNVSTADVDASNGVVHIVDKVIDPSSIVTLAASNPNFSSLVAALTRPDLSIDFIAAISADGPFTVLAPTNDAFQALLDSNPVWNTLNDIPAATLEAVLLYHVSAVANYTSNFLFRRTTVQTLLTGNSYQTQAVFGGGTIGVQINANANTAAVIAADVQAQNGVIHAIDTVILP